MCVAVTLLELFCVALQKFGYSFQVQLHTSCAEQQNPTYIQRIGALNAACALSG